MIALTKVAAGPGHVEVVEHETPRPGPGEVLVEVAAAGVCGTDLHLEDGTIPCDPPVILGHEASGTVVDLGPEVPSEWLGARVVAQGTYSTCGRCRLCRSGREHLCDLRRPICSRADGVFASHVRLPVDRIFRIPDDQDLRAAALHEPLACVCHALCDPTAVGPGDRVLVVGPGPVGLLAGQVAAASGAEVRLAGLERDAQRLALGSELGLGATLVDDLGSDRDFDVVVECSGAAAGLALCLESVKKAGAYVQLGVFGGAVEAPVDLIFRKELSVRPRFSCDIISWQRAQRLVATGRVRLAPLISDICSIEDWPEISARLRRGEGAKILIEPH
ncbi:MAG: alcohol dehydrogenase catalytic domain-containing protein [Actinobacteria bacterium]|nr:alcohol dehydrogenase catalytic domain-containing protein [Actinomycetota bacterium]